eukprot:9188301-Pyramimonas_sp.AAC.1
MAPHSKGYSHNKSDSNHCRDKRCSSRHRTARPRAHGQPEGQPGGSLRDQAAQGATWSPPGTSESSLHR